MTDNYVLYGIVLKNPTQAYTEYKVKNNNVREILQGNIQLVILYRRTSRQQNCKQQNMS
jgi:hypothetical protein